MKTLFIVRHAKSPWKSHEVINDFDRPLKKTGIYNSHLMAKKIKKAEDLSDISILSSPAIRANYTALIFSKTFKFSSKNIILDDNLYDVSYKEVIDSIKSLETVSNTLFIFGHNPSLYDLACHICKDTIKELPTLGVLKLNIDISDWKEVGNAKGKLAEFYDPNKL